MFYTNLQKACELNNIPISRAVVECGGKLGSLSGWKKGAVPSSSIVVALALRLNVSTDYLLGVSTAPENEQKLINAFRLCSEMHQKIILEMIEHYADVDISANKKESASP